MQEAFVLFTIINGRVNYVANNLATRSFDNKKIVSYTVFPHEAKDFGSIKQAVQFIDTIVNPHERVFAPRVINLEAQTIVDVKLDEAIK